MTGCAPQVLHSGPVVPITFGAVRAGGADAPIRALGHARTAADAALGLHGQHRCLPLSLQEPALLTGAGVWREKTGISML